MERKRNRHRCPSKPKQATNFYVQLYPQSDLLLHAARRVMKTKSLRSQPHSNRQNKKKTAKIIFPIRPTPYGVASHHAKKNVFVVAAQKSKEKTKITGELLSRSPRPPPAESHATSTKENRRHCSSKQASQQAGKLKQATKHSCCTSTQRYCIAAAAAPAAAFFMPLEHIRGTRISPGHDVLHHSRRRRGTRTHHEHRPW